MRAVQAGRPGCAYFINAHLVWNLNMNDMTLSNFLREKLRVYRRVIGLLLAGLTASALPQWAAAQSWDGYVSGVVSNVDVSNAGNYPFRLSLVGVPNMCGPESDNWAFVRETDPNYSVYVSVILLAKATGQTVFLRTNKTELNRCTVVFLRIN